MKICPKCARSFADGFTYCPNDAAALEKYDLRARLHSKPELQFLLKHESLAARLWRELLSAMEELRRDPRGYLRSLLRGEGSPRRRKRLLQAGAATAVIAYASIALVTMLIGLLITPKSRPAVIAGPEDEEIRNSWKITLATEPPKSLIAKKSSDGFLGGSQRQRRRARGGGGSGDRTPANVGVAPTASLMQQLKAPDPMPPKIEHPSLIVRETVFADPKSFLPRFGTIGLKDGVNGPLSAGEGPGTGLGPGEGPGYNKGRKGGVGGDDFAPPGGKTAGPGDGPLRMTANLRPTILYKERAPYTEDARQNRVQGVVVLNVTFGADSRIHDIGVMRGLPHGLTEKAIEAAKRIRFTPAIRDGKPVSVRGHIEFNFALY